MYLYDPTQPVEKRLVGLEELRLLLHTIWQHFAVKPLSFNTLKDNQNLKNLWFGS